MVHAGPKWLCGASIQREPMPSKGSSWNLGRCNSVRDSALSNALIYILVNKTNGETHVHPFIFKSKVAHIFRRFTSRIIYMCCIWEVQNQSLSLPCHRTISSESRALYIDCVSPMELVPSEYTISSGRVRHISTNAMMIVGYIPYSNVKLGFKVAKQACVHTWIWSTAGDQT
jgi:hypothetical protein